MQIDVAESLIASWLRHMEKYPVVQNNWKAPNWEELEPERESRAEGMREKFRQFCKGKGGVRVFGKEDKLGTILKQCEIDVVGIKVEKKKKLYIKAGDVAFHSHGLNYGGNKRLSPAWKVVSKIMRSILSLTAYIDFDELHIFFASPFVRRTDTEKIKDLIGDLQEFLYREMGKSIRIDLLLNSDFVRSIVKGIEGMASKGKYTNTQELFLRFCQLKSNCRDAFGHIPKKGEKNVEEQQKVGELVQGRFKKLCLGCKDKKLLRQLCDKEYSRKVFKLSYAALLPINAEGLSGKLHTRYYVEPVTILGKKYRICNDWYSRNKKLLEAWLKKHEGKEETL